MKIGGGRVVMKRDRGERYGGKKKLPQKRRKIFSFVINNGYSFILILKLGNYRRVEGL